MRDVQGDAHKFISYLVQVLWVSLPLHTGQGRDTLAEKTMKEILDLYSINNCFRVSITEGIGGNLRVTTWKWTHEIVPGYGEVCDPFWEDISGPSITDAIETATTIAEDEFRRLTGNKNHKNTWTNPDSKNNG